MFHVIFEKIVKLIMSLKIAKTCLKDRAWLYDQYIIRKKNQTDIAKELGVSTNTIKRYLDLHEIATLPLTAIRTNHIDENTLALINDRDWLYAKYHIEKLSLTEISKILKFDRGSLRRQLKRFNIPLISHKIQVQRNMSSDTIMKLDDPKWLYEQYIDNDLSMIAIEKKYGINRKLIALRLKKYNIPLKGHDYEVKKHYPAKSIKLLKDKEWLETQHKINRLSVKKISKILDVSGSTVARRMKEFGIKIIILPSSGLEQDVVNFIEANNFKCITNTRKIINPYEIDIYIPSHKIAIEFNGMYWHSDAFKDKNYHKRKHDLVAKNGIKLLQIFEDDWILKNDIIKTKLLHILGKSNLPKIFARKTTIKNVEPETKIAFFNKYHIQGNGPSSINYGLYHNDELVAVMGFIKNNNYYTLNRYATSCHVVGGFSKLLKHFETKYNYPKIITFADLMWSNGDLYYKNGFTVDKILNPDYSWIIKCGQHYERQHKFNWRHKNLKKKLHAYDPKLTEVENMHIHGFNRIYDAGKLRFVKNP